MFLLVFSETLQERMGGFIDIFRERKEIRKVVFHQPPSYLDEKEEYNSTVQNTLTPFHRSHSARLLDFSSNPSLTTEQQRAHNVLLT